MCKLERYRRGQGRKTLTASFRRRVPRRGSLPKLSEERAPAARGLAGRPGLCPGSSALCHAYGKNSWSLPRWKLRPSEDFGRHHASPAEENHLLHSRGAELRLRAGDGGSHRHAAVGQGDDTLQDGSPARQRHWPGAGEVYWRNPVWAFPRPACEAVWARGETFPVFMWVTMAFELFNTALLMARGAGRCCPCPLARTQSLTSVKYSKANAAVTAFWSSGSNNLFSDTGKATLTFSTIYICYTDTYISKDLYYYYKKKEYFWFSINLSSSSVSTLHPLCLHERTN